MDHWTHFNTTLRNQPLDAHLQQITFWCQPNSRWMPPLISLTTEQNVYKSHLCRYWAKIWRGGSWESSPRRTLSTNGSLQQEYSQLLYETKKLLSEEFRLLFIRIKNNWEAVSSKLQKKYLKYFNKGNKLTILSFSPSLLWYETQH